MSKGFGNLMRQAQMMKKKIAEAQEAVEAQTFDGEAGQGKVKVTVSGGLETKSISIEKELVDPDDTGMLEDLIVVAVNDAITKANKAKDDEMSRLTGGLDLKMPGLF